MKTNKPDKSIERCNKAIDKVGNALRDCFYKCSLLGHPVKRITYCWDEDCYPHMWITYFKIPKAKKVIERMRK